MSDKAFPVSWDQFHRDARALAWRLSSQGPFDAIVCVTRGGLVPAAIVSRELNVRIIDTLCVSSYQAATPGGEEVQSRQGDIEILKNISRQLRDRVEADAAKILIVDDLVDTGKTARIVREIVPRAHFATVYAKPKGRPLVDTFVTEVSQDTWIYFPWDLALAFQPPIRSDS